MYPKNNRLCLIAGLSETVLMIFGFAAETEKMADIKHITSKIPKGTVNNSRDKNSEPPKVTPEPNNVIIIPIIRVSILIIMPALLSAMAM